MKLTSPDRIIMVVPVTPRTRKPTSAPTGGAHQPARRPRSQRRGSRVTVRAARIKLLSVRLTDVPANTNGSELLDAIGCLASVGTPHVGVPWIVTVLALGMVVQRLSMARVSTSPERALTSR